MGNWVEDNPGSMVFGLVPRPRLLDLGRFCNTKHIAMVIE